MDFHQLYHVISNPVADNMTQVSHYYDALFCGSIFDDLAITYESRGVPSPKWLWYIDDKPRSLIPLRAVAETLVHAKRGRVLYLPTSSGLFGQMAS